MGKKPITKVLPDTVVTLQQWVLTHPKALDVKQGRPGQHTGSVMDSQSTTASNVDTVAFSLL